MGHIHSGLTTIATERARQFRSVEKIVSEVMESAVDDAIEAAMSELKLSGEFDDSLELADLMEIIPDTEDDSEDEEIENILLADSDSIDIDDMLGIVDPEEELAVV